jgi:hypothetical protein
VPDPVGEPAQPKRPMTALSLWQPWASYIAAGMKRFETRHWATNYRGPLAIHAAKRPLTEDERWLLEDFPLAYGHGPLPFGAIVATCELVDCLRITGHPGDDREHALGEWSPGRYAWALVNVQRLPVPIPCRGAQGLWTWRPDAD